MRRLRWSGCALARSSCVIAVARWPQRRSCDRTAQLAGREPRSARSRAGSAHARELAASLDPDDVLDRTLDADRRAARASTRRWSRSRTGPRDGAPDPAAGLSEDEIERTLLQMPAHPDLRAIEVVYRYRLDDVERDLELPRSALDRRAPRRRRDDRLARGDLPLDRARLLASRPRTRSTRSRAAPARRSGTRSATREARELAELDSLTGLHNRRLFYEFLAREIARAQRYERFVSRDRVRPRRLQAHQRPDRPPRRRRAC